MKKLFLDDVRDSIDCAEYMHRRIGNVKIYHENWDIVRNYKQFISYIKNNELPEIISFDHDLGTKKDGKNCAEFLVNYCIDNKKELPKCFIHSWNPIGIKKIENCLNDYLKIKS